MGSNIDARAALQHAKNCQGLAIAIDQAFKDWLSGHKRLYDSANFSAVRHLLGEHDEPFIWSSVYAALRREFSTIEPLLNQ